MKKIIIVSLCFIVAITVNITNFMVFADELIAPNSKSAILVDANTGKILLEQNSTEKLPVASIVKLMTLNIVFERIDKGELNLSDEIRVSEHAASMGGSQLFLDANTDHKVGDLLKSVIVASANDSTVVLAEAVCGSEQNFIREMNARAKELNLNNTIYTDCTGLKENQYSTANDVAKISKIVLNHPLYLKYSKIWLENYIHPSGRITEIANTNKLIRTLDGCVAGKTGTTDNAGFCLSAMAERKGMRLIGVVLGAENVKYRFDNAKSLINVGFANYVTHKILDKEIAIGILSNNKLKPDNVEIFASKDYDIVERRNQEIDVKYEIELFEDNKPIKANEVIGKVYVIQSGKIVDEVDVITKVDLNYKKYKDYILKIIKYW